MDECSSKPCLNGGQCQDVEGDYHCLCALGLLVKTANTVWTTAEASRVSMAALAQIPSRAYNANVDPVSLAFNVKSTLTSA
jgi:hypothetical protein